MKSEVELWEVCLREAGFQHHVRIHRDLETSRKRVEHEGLAFLTITLPRFEKDLLSAISSGRIGSNHFAGFRRSGGLPAFLSGFLCQVFDKKGVLRDDASSSVLRSLRQVLLLLSKVEYEVSDQRKAAAVKAYIATDGQLVELNDRLRNIFRSSARVLLGDFLREVEHRLYWRDWMPGHSTGALATGESPNGRYNNATWTERLQNVLRWEDELTTCPSEIYHSSEDITVLAREDEPPAKLVLVPKTMKGPRVIVEEPVYAQYVQQGIFHLMSDVLSQPRNRGLLDSFGWHDQEPNRTLAREGSMHSGFATLDLSEASDRVSLELVELLLDSVPFLRDAVFACRSERVQVGRGQTVQLRKFASMGSALCFPIESMVFYVIASIALAEHNAVAPSALRTSRKYGTIRVYGDDIIVPSTVAQSAARWLETFGLKVNVDKTFTTGHFRESCGSDWFHGEDVSVFKLRTPLPAKRRHLESLRSTIEFHNRAYSQGWFLVAEHVENLIKRIIPACPRVPVGVRASALWSYDEPTAVRHHRDLHRPEYRVLLFREVKPRDRLEGYGALKKTIVRRSHDPHAVDHLERGGRSRCVGVNIGWICDTPL